MRASVFASACILVLAFHATSGLANELKPFDFKGVTAGGPVDVSSIAKCGAADKDGLVICTPKNRAMAGRTRIDGPKMGFVDSRLVYVTYKYDLNDYPVLLEMLQKKYGAAVNKRIGNWDSSLKSGGGQDRWDFKTGVLTSTIDKDGRGGRLLYRDDYTPKDKEIVPDF